MIQFAKAVLVKMLHNIFRHNTDYVIYSSVCFAACLPATDLHDLLRDKFLLNNAVKLTVPKDTHTKFVLVLRL